MLDHPFAAALLVIAVVWTALAVKRELRVERQRDWDAHVTTTPGMTDLRAPDWALWADEIRGLA